MGETLQMEQREKIKKKGRTQKAGVVANKMEKWYTIKMCPNTFIVQTKQSGPLLSSSTL